MFPVLGPVTYNDGWGEYRGDIAGNFHIGTDIIGVKLQPEVAVVTGTVVRTGVDHPTAGMTVTIQDAEGWQYTYLHINNDSPNTNDAARPVVWRLAPGIAVGTHVTAGQLLAYMGNSGDSEFSVPHLHFEIHRPDGAAVNPFPSVRASEMPTRCAPPADLGQIPNLSLPTDTDAQVVEVVPLTGYGSFTLSANGTVFLVGSARNIGMASANRADGDCPTIDTASTDVFVSPIVASAAPAQIPAADIANTGPLYIPLSDLSPST